MQVEGLDFRAAVESLGLHLPEGQRPARPAPTPAPPVRLSQMTADKAYLTNDWQQHAESFIDACVYELQQAKKPRQYLAERGLRDFTWQTNMLGFNPDDRYEEWGGIRVWLPRGIIIPWEIDRMIWNIRIRQSPKNRALRVGEAKYISVAGGTALGLWHGTLVRPGRVVLLVEGEFDAMLSDQVANAAHLPIRCVATGGVGNARLLRWVSLLSLASRVLVAFDTDKPGEVASKFWLEALPNARRYMPLCHDVTDMWHAGADIASWLRGGLV
jgi:DNA primase